MVLSIYKTKSKDRIFQNYIYLGNNTDVRQTSDKSIHE